MDKKESYKQFWLSLFESKTNYEDINNAFTVLFDKNLEDELYKNNLAVQNDIYREEYETWMKKAQEIDNKKKIECKFHFGTFYLPYLYYVSSELMNWSELRDQRIDSKGILQTSMQGLVSTLVPVSAKVLVQEVKRLHAKSELGDGESSEQFKMYEEKVLNDKLYRQEMFQLYPVLFEKLALKTKMFLEFYKDIIENVLSVWEELQISDGITLDRIVLGQGDTHNYGKSVAKLLFSNQSIYIYKPRELTVDVAFNKLLKKYNTWVGEGQDLKTFSVINRKNFGIVELILYNNQVDDEKKKKYYFRCGELLAILYSLNASDMHCENLIASGEYPVIIDCETVVSPFATKDKADLQLLEKTESLKRTGLLPLYIGSNPEKVEIGGIGTTRNHRTPYKTYAVKNQGKSDINLVFDYQEVKKEQNIFGSELNKKNIADIENGFHYAYMILMRHKGEYAKIVEALFADVQIRVILKSTAVYSTLLGLTYHPDILMDNLSQRIILCKDYVEHYRKFETDIYILENQALLRGDIPYFYTYTNEKGIFAEGGKVADFYSVPPVKQILDKIKNLSEDDLHFQERILHQSYFGEKAEYSKDITGLMFEDYSIDKNEYLQLAEKILDVMLDKSFTFGDSYRSWMDCLYDDRNDKLVNYSYVGGDLYNGEAGIALAYLYYGVVSGKSYYIEIAENIAAYGNSEIKFYNENRHSLIGAFTGLAGNLYLNSKLFKYTKKEIYKKHCLQLISKIDKILVYDKMTDIIGGAAGYLLVLCSIFENIEEPQLLVVVKEQMKAVEKILVKRYSANNGGWKLTLEGKEKIYTGFGHGDSGIITALARCDHLLGSTNNREIINEVIRKHKSLFSYENKGWYRTNEKELIGYGWCHGTSGILLSRVLLKKYGYENIDDDIKCAMEISSTRSFGNNTSLCHGDFSSLEIMKLAGKVLHDKKVLEREKLSFHWLYENVMQERYGGKCFRGTEVLGLMLGLSGYVYSLVQHSSNEIPSILYLQ